MQITEHQYCLDLSNCQCHEGKKEEMGLLAGKVKEPGNQTQCAIFARDQTLKLSKGPGEMARG